MSRIGKKPIPIPDKVRVEIQGNQITVKGPNGELSYAVHPDIKVVQEEKTLQVVRPTDQRTHRALHGLTRALLMNMITGVSEGYRKTLEIVGTGYRAELQGSALMLYLGHSHPIEINPPKGISFDVPKGGRLVTVQGADKELVGEIAARIRRQRPPEPYQGKGVRYQNELVRHKAGKTGKVGK